MLSLHNLIIYFSVISYCYQNCLPDHWNFFFFIQHFKYFSFRLDYLKFKINWRFGNAKYFGSNGTLIRLRGGSILNGIIDKLRQKWECVNDDNSKCVWYKHIKFYGLSAVCLKFKLKFSIFYNLIKFKTLTIKNYQSKFESNILIFFKFWWIISFFPQILTAKYQITARRDNLRIVYCIESKFWKYGYL